MTFEETSVIPRHFEQWLRRRLLEHDHRLGLITDAQLEEALADVPPVAVADEHEEG